MLEETPTTPAERTFYDVPEPKQFNKFQWCIVGTTYLFVAFLFAFIIYISATWNKVRINEYT